MLGIRDLFVMLPLITLEPRSVLVFQSTVHSLEEGKKTVLELTFADLEKIS